MDWHQLWTIVSLPDNVPIVLLLFVVPFYTWYGMRQAHANDRLIAQLEADPALAKTHHRKTQPWKPGWAKEVHVWLQEMLVYFDPWIAGVIMPSLIIVGLMVIPYIDANPLGNGYYTYKQRKFAIWTFIFGFIILWVTMIVIGTLIRGPGWMWFWPGMTWDHNRLIYEINRDLPDIFGIKNALLKNLFGAIVIGAYAVAAGIGIHKLIVSTPLSRKIYARMSLLQYSIMQMFLIIMLALPVKILIRLLFRIKYVWITPWFNV
jgi:hypothetical protein